MNVSESVVFRAYVAFFVLTLLLGGAGSAYPVLQGIQEIAALAVLAVAALHWRGIKPPALLRAALVLCLLWLALLLVQVVPLPASWWRALPSHALAVTVLDASGTGDTWRAMSLRPDRTARAILTFLPFLAALVGGTVLSPDWRLLVIKLIVSIALFDMALGAIQVATAGAPAAAPWRTSHAGFATGLFVNRNHNALFLLIGLVLAAFLAGGRSSRQQAATRNTKILWTAAAAALALGVVSTASRSGLVLLPVALAVCAAFAIRGTDWRARLGGLAAVGLLAGILAHTPLVERVMSRFASAGEDGRFTFWHNTLDAIGRSLPLGTGIGSFRTIYPTAEQLDDVAGFAVNNAHNDYLELALEAGLPGLLLLAAAILLVVLGLMAALHSRSGEQRRLALAAAGSLLLFALCSINDYPLRMTSLEVVAGILVALVLAPGGVERRSSGRRQAATTWRLVGLVALAVGGLVVLWQSAAWAVSDRAALASDGATATAWQPRSAAAWSALRVQRLAEDDDAGAKAAADRTLAITPIDPAALGTLALLAERRRDPAAAQRYLTVTAQLGWRDPVSQLLLAQRAATRSDTAGLVARLDAYLRGDPENRRSLSALVAVTAEPAGAALVAAHLTRRPAWRSGYFYALADLPEGGEAGVLQMLRRLRALGAAATQEELAPLLTMEQSRGRGDLATELLRAAGRSALIEDGTFERTTELALANNQPHVWSRLDRFGVTVGINDLGPQLGHTLLLSSDGSAIGPVVRQLVTLRPGTYQFSALVRGPAEARSRLEWQIGCRVGAKASAAGTLPVTVTNARDGWSRVAGEFTVPPQGCSAQDLSLTVTTAGAWISVEVDNVTIDPVPDGDRS